MLIDEIVDLEYLVARLSLQIHLVVSDLIQVIVNCHCHIEIGRNELIGVVLVRLVASQSAVVEGHGVATARGLPGIGTLQVLPVHRVRNLGWPLRYRRVAISLLLDEGRRIRVLYPRIGSTSFRSALASSGHIGCAASLAVGWDHGPAGIEHLEEATVVVTELVAVFLLVELVALA